MTHSHETRRARPLALGLRALLLSWALIVGLVAPVAQSAHAATEPVGRAGVALNGPELLFSTDADLSWRLDRIRESGATSMRVEVATTQLTWQPGQYDWPRLDRVVNGARQRGLTVLAMVAQTPAYARPAGSSAYRGPATDAERAGYVGFVDALAQRYQGRIAAYEIWEAPNIAAQWSPRPDPGSYAALLSAASSAIKGRDPSATVVTGGLATANVSADVPATEFLHALYRVGAQRSFDVVGAMPWVDPHTGDLADFDRLYDYRGIMDGRGDGGKAIWVTRTGVAAGAGYMSEERAASVLADVSAKWDTVHHRGPLFLFTIQDSATSGPNGAMGLFRRDGSPKQTFGALRSLLTNFAGRPAPAPAPPVEQQAALRDNTGIAVEGTKLLFTSQSNRDRDLDRIAATGVRWLRVDVALTQITWAGPQQREWAPLDAVIEGANRRGLKVLGILSQVPVYARPHGTGLTHPPSTDAERSSVAQFAEEAARRYNGRINAWEIWNEPNLTSYWAGGANPDQYVRLLKVLYPRIKQADPAATVLTGGTGGAWQSTDIKPLAWIQRLYDHGAQSSFDAVSIHMFTNPIDGNVGEITIVDQYRAVLDRNGDSTKEMWATEIGTTTGGDRFASEDQAAKWQTEMLRRWRSVHHSGPAMVFTLNDEAGRGREGYFGLIRPDGSLKPAYHELVRVMRDGV